MAKQTATSVAGIPFYAITSITADPNSGMAMNGTWVVGAEVSADVTPTVVTGATTTIGRTVIKALDVSEIRVSHVLEIIFTNTSAALETYQAVVEYVDYDNGYIGIAWLKTGTAIDHDATANQSVELRVISSANYEGARRVGQTLYELPAEFYNFCQIFRAPYDVTGTALKSALKFDDEGPYKTIAKQYLVKQNIEMEKGFIWGERSLQALSGKRPMRTTGGILFFLRQWELGTVYGNSATAITSEIDPQKRIMENTGGVITEPRYDAMLEKAFTRNSSISNQKLALCGNGFLSTVNRLYKTQGTLNWNIPAEGTYGMNIVSHVTPFGELVYKTHPLFTQNAALTYNALIVDVSELKYRYVTDRDVELLVERQDNDEDVRVDEWLGEAGLEVRLPESHMYLKNFQEVGN